MKTFTLSRISLSSLLIAILLLSGCLTTQNDKESFKFAFLTDIHLNQGENGSFDGMKMAINSAHENGAAFIITGGDNVDIDGLKSDTATAKMMYQRYRDLLDESPIEVNATIGNHDRFWGIVTDEKPYGETLFEEYLNPTYYSFDHSEWKFMVLNTVQVKKGSYVVDSLQLEWIKTELAKTSELTPIILSMHVPMMSVYSASGPGRFGPDMFNNFAEVKDLFNNYNVKLVLQGHQHLYEEIKTRGVQYITGGAVSASWWGGQYYETEEGYLLVTISGDDFSWEYIDYGWEAKK